MESSAPSSAFPGSGSGGVPAAGPPTIGVLAYQGDFERHFQALERAGAKVRKVRRQEDLSGLSGLIIPGGESTTMVRLAKVYGMFEELRRAGEGGLPMFGTCAGAILLGRGDANPERLGLVPATVHRNAYGRQRESFDRRVRLDHFGDEFDCVFIRAPKIDPDLGPGVEVLGRDGNDPILIRYGKFLLSTFHPELTDDLRIHQLFLEMCGKGK